jgi:mercuric ion transport protein
MGDAEKKYRNRFLATLVGTVVVALCCFTPALVVLLAAVGLAVLTPYLDYVLFPALAVLMVLAVLSYRRWRRSCAAGDA